MSPELVLAGLTILVVVGLAFWVVKLKDDVADHKVDTAEQREKEAKDHAQWTNETVERVEDAAPPVFSDEPRAWDL